MPQFPEISLYFSALERRIPGRKLERVRVVAPFLLGFLPGGTYG